MEQAKLIDGTLCVSTTVMQSMFGVNRTSLGNWVKNGCPKAKPGWWPLVEVVKWRGFNTKVSGSDEEMTAGELKQKYDAEYKRLQAEKLELQNAIAHGEYVSRSEITGELSRYFSEFKISLMGLSRQIATEVGPFTDPPTARRIERDLDDLIRNALARMSSGETYEPTKKRVIRKAAK